MTKPSREHPKRPIWGLECPQREVSGSRFWSLVQSISGCPDAFFNNCYVYNYCPLVFLGMSGKNITPPSLGSSAREPLLQACDKALVDIVNLMGIEKIVAVGRFVEERSKLVLKTANREDVEVIFIMHPSPINPKANAGWESIVKGQLEEAKIAHFFPHFYNPIPVTFSTTAANGPSTCSTSSANPNNNNKLPKDPSLVSPVQNVTTCEKLNADLNSQSQKDSSLIKPTLDRPIKTESCYGRPQPSTHSSSLDSATDPSPCGKAPPSLVGQLSIASEASTFADEFLKAEVTITSNSLASAPLASSSARVEESARVCQASLESASVSIKCEPNDCAERSAIDNLIASTQAQQHSLSFSGQEAAQKHLQNSNNGAGSLYNPISSSPSPNCNTSSSSSQSSSFQLLPNHQQQQGPTDSGSSSHPTIPQQSQSQSHASAISTSIDSNSVAPAVNSSRTMLMPDTLDLHSQHHHPQLVDSTSSTSFFPPHKMLFAGQSAPQMPPPHHAMGASPYLYENAAHLMHPQPPPPGIAATSHHYGPPLNSYGGPVGSGAAAGPGAYASGAPSATGSTNDVYHNHNSNSLASSPLYSPHLMQQQQQFAPSPYGLSAAAAAQYNTASGLASTPQTILDSANAAAAGSYMNVAGATTAQAPPPPPNSYFNQSAAAQYDCYAPTSNLLS